MEQNNCLGIYLSPNRATALVLSGRSSHPEILAAFSLKKPEHDDESEAQSSLVAELARKLAAEKLAYDEVAVCVDCVSYSQHNLRSDFADHRQIANTIAFDAEEALACDATELALTFTVTGTDENGSRVSVFTSNREQMQTQLKHLQHENLDPVSIEPDIVCLARYIRESFSMPKESNPLFVVLSDEACYLINLPDGHHDPFLRSFILNSSGDLTRTLCREIPLTIASLNSSRPIDGVLVAGRIDGLDLKTITERTALPAEKIDLGQMVHASKSTLADCQSVTDFAAAYGAALAEVKRIRPSDFRASFAPYQGKKVILQRSLRAISVFATISLVVVGIYLQLKVFRMNDYTSQLKTKLVEEYGAANYGRRPQARRSIPRLLDAQAAILRKGQTGFGDESSVTAKLTYALEALGKAPKAIDFNVNTISITRSVKITGDTNSRASTLALQQSFKNLDKLEKTNQRITADNNRDKFEFTFELKKGTR